MFYIMLKKRATREGALVADEDDDEGSSSDIPPFLKNRNY